MATHHSFGTTHQVRSLTTWQIILSVFAYLILSFGMIGLFVAHGYFVGDSFEQVGVVAQATAGVGAILLVSLLLYRIAKNTDRTLAAQQMLTNEQRLDDQIDFLEKHLNKAIRPIQQFCVSLLTAVHTLQGIGVVAGARCADDNGPKTSFSPEEEKQIWAEFENDCENRLAKALEELNRKANEMIASTSVVALYPVSETPPSNKPLSGLREYARRLAILSTAYKSLLVHYRDQPFKEKRRLFNNLLNPDLFWNMLRITSGVESRFDEFMQNMPGIDMLHQYILSLITDLDTSTSHDARNQGICNRLPSFKAALVVCKLRPGDWDAQKLSEHAGSTKVELWGLKEIEV